MPYQQKRTLQWTIVLCAATSLPGCMGGSTTVPSGSTFAIPSSMTSGSALGPRSGEQPHYTGCPCLYVANLEGNDTITVYPATATGAHLPIAHIIGTNTGLGDPSAIAVDSSGKIYVTNVAAQSVTVYPANSTGNAAPLRTIAGAATGLVNPYGIAVATGGVIYVSNGVDASVSSITVYAAGAHGNVAPIRTITGPATGLAGPFGIALDPAGRLYVANYNSTVTVYAAGANGNAAPIQTLGGSNTDMGGNGVFGVAWAANRIYVTGGVYTITIFPDNATGNVAPIKEISGSLTKLDDPLPVAVAATGDIYVGNISGTYSITSYERFSLLSPGNNNIAPLTDLTAAIHIPYGIAVH